MTIRTGEKGNHHKTQIEYRNDITKMTQTHPMLFYVFGKKETVSNSTLTTLQCDLQSHIQLPKLIRRKVTIIDLYI